MNIIMINFGYVERLKGSYLTFLALLDRVTRLYRDENGNFWGRRRDPVKIIELSYKTGRRRRTIINDIKKLEKLNFIKVKKVPYGYLIDVRMLYGKFWTGLAYKRMAKQKDLEILIKAFNKYMEK